MPDERRYYVISDDNCKFESMTREQILAAITQAVEQHSISDVDTGFVQTVKEQHRGEGLKFWIGTSAEYTALPVKDESTFYILTDDSELDDLESEIASLRSDLTIVQGQSIAALDRLYMEFAKAAHNFTGETIPTGEVNIPLAKCEYDSQTGQHFSFRLDDYSQVKVRLSSTDLTVYRNDLVTCNVCNMGSGITYILGIGTVKSNSDQIAVQTSICLKCLSDGSNHSVIENNSKTFYIQDQILPSVYPAQIYGIYGIDYRIY